MTGNAADIFFDSVRYNCNQAGWDGNWLELSSVRSKIAVRRPAPPGGFWLKEFALTMGRITDRNSPVINERF
jgi:hypothetical protein